MKQKIIFVGCCVVCFLMGLALMRVWNAHSLAKNKSLTLFSTSVPAAEMADTIDLEMATDPEDLRAVDDPGEPRLATESQLAPIHMPEIEMIISRSGKSYPTEEQEPPAKTAVPLGDVQYNTSPTAQTSEQEAPKSNIVMIAAPVEPLLIKTLEEYKKFKRRARGNYPVANFATENVLVLESASNLPDKVFEIQNVEEKDGKMLVTYRVNVFGLDQKTNTHSAVLILKRDLPIELKQVL